MHFRGSFPDEIWSHWVKTGTYCYLHFLTFNDSQFTLRIVILGSDNWTGLDTFQIQMEVSKLK
jgi:hypothetical protein